MSLADRFRSMLNKKSDPASPKELKPEPPVTPKKSPPMEERGRLIAQEKTEGESKLRALEKELEGIRGSLEKIEVTAKCSRETQGQTLQYLQQDAEREIKFFERKLREDMKHWDQQLKDREKALQQSLLQVETGQLEMKSASEKSDVGAREAAARTESLLKEQETKLLENRQRWRDLLQAKENELVTVKQELARRETDIENEMKQQEAQRVAAQELWQARMQDLERQWTDKRKSWEEVMKAKEQERLRLQSTFQEKQASWQLEQERRIQDATRRQERAQEKLAALQAHLVKETQNWQELAQSREDQVQQLKVKLLLSESEAKGQLDQAQKTLQESVSHLTGQIQTLQRQIQQEQETWQKQMETKDQDIHKLKEDIHNKLRRMETDFTQRITVLNSEKETLTSELHNLQTEYHEAQKRYTEATEKLKTEQTALESAYETRVTEWKGRAEAENAALRAQITSIEKQKGDTERELDARRLRWQEELRVKEQALKEVQNTVTPQETELRKRYAAEEESLTRELDGLKVRLRTLEREYARTRENIEKTEKEQLSVMQALQDDHRQKEEALRARSAELTDRLKKRLEERHLALEAFLLMKKNEESRVQNELRTKEKERVELSTRLQTLPQELAYALENHKKTVQKETEQLRGRLQALESDLAKARGESKTIVQAKATQLAALRQSLEQKHKGMTASLRSQEQVLEAERAQIEKQMTAGQAEVDRVRSHWQVEIDKKEKEAQALQEELRKQEATQRQNLEAEQRKLDNELKPLEHEKHRLSDALAQQSDKHAAEIHRLEQETAACQNELQDMVEKDKADKAAMETRFRQERVKWKAHLEALSSERDGVLRAGRETFERNTHQIKQLEEQLSSQAVAHETRRREIVHQATLKSRTLQDVIGHMEQELKSAEELLPRELEERTAVIASLQQELAEIQKKYERTLSRFDRAQATLERRGREKEEALRKSLAASQEEGAKKLAGRDSEIAALQSNLLAKESERQGELDRLAKQFAEERFQLEKSKEELEWKLKDRKEVSERQLAARQKEIQALENEVHRVKAQRDQEIAQKNAAFEAEKKKLQGMLASLQKQTEETRQTQEGARTAKGQELQALLARSKEHLRVLGEEFNQKVGSWRATNDSLRAQTEQLKGHVAQSQDHWEALRKEKTNQISALRQELAEWEARIKNDAEEFERNGQLERQTLIAQVRQQETNLQDTVADYEGRLKNQEEEMTRASEEIRNHEQKTEDEWHAALEQWQTDKQALQQQMAHREQELVSMQNRFQTELRQTDDAMAKLKMEITFKETHAASQKERLAVQLQRDLDPLRDRLARLTREEEDERNAWEVRLHAKEDELKMLKTRLTLREKRIQDEHRRRTVELDKLRKQLAQETESARAHYEAERSRLEKLLLERREDLARLAATETDYRKSEVEANSQVVQAALRQKHQLEESLRQILAEREALREHYESLMADRDANVETHQGTLDVKEQELEAIREHAKDETHTLHKKMELLRQIKHKHTARHGPTNAAAWNTFEVGVHHYQSQQWAEAVQAFEDCLQKDPRWGAAYQYLALAYHAQGNTVKAAETAVRAKELDPGNTHLTSWVNRLQAAMNERKAS